MSHTIDLNYSDRNFLLINSSENGAGHLHKQKSSIVRFHRKVDRNASGAMHIRHVT